MIPKYINARDGMPQLVFKPNPEFIKELVRLLLNDDPELRKCDLIACIMKVYGGKINPTQVEEVIDEALEERG